MNVGQCHCPEPQEGERIWCARHGVAKTAHWQLLCRTKPAYFKAWEEGLCQEAWKRRKTSMT